MAHDNLDPRQKLLRKFDERNKRHLAAEDELKRSVDLDFDFPQCLVRLIAKSNEEVTSIATYRLANIDEDKRSELKAKIKIAMTSPRETGSFQLAMAFSEDESYALKYAELEGLIVLGMLGDTEIIPNLLVRLAEEKSSSARMRIVAGAVLRHLTGQDIGGYILSNKDISLWKEWWEQNKNISEK